MAPLPPPPPPRPPALPPGGRERFYAGLEVAVAALDPADLGADPAMLLDQPLFLFGVSPGLAAAGGESSVSGASGGGGGEVRSMLRALLRESAWDSAELARGLVGLHLTAWRADPHEEDAVLTPGPPSWATRLALLGCLGVALLLVVALLAGAGWLAFVGARALWRAHAAAPATFWSVVATLVPPHAALLALERRARRPAADGWRRAHAEVADRAARALVGALGGRGDWGTERALARLRREWLRRLPRRAARAHRRMLAARSSLAVTSIVYLAVVWGLAVSWIVLPPGGPGATGGSWGGSGDWGEAGRWAVTGALLGAGWGAVVLLCRRRDHAMRAAEAAGAGMFDRLVALIDTERRRGEKGDGAA